MNETQSIVADAWTRPPIPIPEYVKTAVAAVHSRHGGIRAIRVLRDCLTSQTTEYETEYAVSFRPGRVNAPTLMWCKRYVDAL